MILEAFLIGSILTNSLNLVIYNYYNSKNQQLPDVVIEVVISESELKKGLKQRSKSLKECKKENESKESA